MSEEKEQMIDGEVFRTFFHENYCEVEYANVKQEFEEIAGQGLSFLFVDGTDFSKITGKNFILYLRSSVYGEFEAIVEEIFDSLNPEITDAVMDVSANMEEQDLVTGIYWETCEKLLKDFLGQLFEEVITKLIQSEIRQG